MNAVSTIVLLVVTSVCAMGEPKNLLPNGNFEGKEPLKGWLTEFPDEGFYKDNAPYVKVTEAGGRRAVMLDLPAGIVGNQVVVGFKHRLAAVAAGHHVVDRTGILETDRSRHGAACIETPTQVRQMLIREA